MSITDIMWHMYKSEVRKWEGGGGGREDGGGGEDNTPARRLAARLAATEPAMTALPALDTAETAVEGGRYLST